MKEKYYAINNASECFLVKMIRLSMVIRSRYLLHIRRLVSLGMSENIRIEFKFTILMYDTTSVLYKGKILTP